MKEVGGGWRFPIGKDNKTRIKILRSRQIGLKIFLYVFSVKKCFKIFRFFYSNKSTRQKKPNKILWICWSGKILFPHIKFLIYSLRGFAELCTVWTLWMSRFYAGWVTGDWKDSRKFQIVWWQDWKKTTSTKSFVWNAEFSINEAEFHHERQSAKDLIMSFTCQLSVGVWIYKARILLFRIVQKVQRCRLNCHAFQVQFILKKSNAQRGWRCLYMDPERSETVVKCSRYVVRGKMPCHVHRTYSKIQTALGDVHKHVTMLLPFFPFLRLRFDRRNWQAFTFSMHFLISCTMWSYILVFDCNFSACNLYTSYNKLQVILLC